MLRGGSPPANANLDPTRSTISAGKAWLLLCLVLLAVIAVDQLSKQLAMTAVDRGSARELIFGVEIVNVRNKGVAFGALSESDAPVIAFAVLALLALTVYFALNARRPGLWLVAGLLAGGALANLTDRLSHGAVVDFLNFPAWPAFNFADVAIVIGAVGLALLLMSGRDVDDATS